MNFLVVTGLSGAGKSMAANALEDIAVLRFAMAENPGDASAPYLLGNLFYDRRRYAEARELWERSV